MKNKKNVYILLPSVLLIWGSVVYQFFSFSSHENKEVKASKEYAFKSLKFKPRDTASINVNYRDPFLGKRCSPQNGNVIKRRIVKSINPIVKSEPIILPTVVYKGIVSDTNEKTKIFMLIINGRTFLMKKGDIESEVLLKEGNRESVNVKNRGVLQTIQLQE